MAREIERLDFHIRGGMFLAEPRGDERDARHRRRDDAQPQRADHALTQTREIFPQAAVVGQNLAPPREHAFSLRSQPHKMMPPDHEPGFEVFLKLANGGGKCGLRHIADLGRAREMPFAGESHEIGKVPNQHSLPHTLFEGHYSSSHTGAVKKRWAGLRLWLGGIIVERLPIKRNAQCRR